MAGAVTHIWRMLRWGRILGRHGALRAIETSPLSPPRVRWVARLARFGSFAPKEADYAGAFRAIGPAAVKLGQALATRPDVIGVEAAMNLLTLQDKLPPLPFVQMRAAIEQGLGGSIDQHFARFDEDAVGSASIAQVYRAQTHDGRDVAVKVLRPGVRARFLADIETYGWAAAHIEALGGEAARLRPRDVIANFKRWTLRELDLRREAASASELAESAAAISGYHIPTVDWERTSGSLLTIEWIAGTPISDVAALKAAGHDVKAIAARLVQAFLHQAVNHGFFHADAHQGNLLVDTDGNIVAVDFGIMGRIDRQARVWLAEILYGLMTGNYARVAQIHFDAQYVPAHHDVAEFASALRAVGEPMRGKPVKELSVGQMLDGLFAITRDFDMVTQPHLLLLQKTMVMVEGVALTLDPEINMWDVAGPFISDWMRDELGPEAKLADGIIHISRVLRRLPTLIERLEDHFPAPGGAPPQPPVEPVTLVWQGGFWAQGWRYIVSALLGGVAGAAAAYWWL